MLCPACRADNAATDSSCRRCKTDLSLLIALEEQHRHHVSLAESSLSTGQLGAALAHARQAHALRHSPDATRLLAMAHLLTGDFPQAWRHYLLIRGLTPPARQPVGSSVQTDPQD